ncbi:MAG: hypothetical protein KDN20_07775 [Verrucomicrobiae bacterium]|nr:hypothetical protein [Verrucomicrobiae bacterium]
MKSVFYLQSRLLLGSFNLFGIALLTFGNSGNVLAQNGSDLISTVISDDGTIQPASDVNRLKRGPWGDLEYSYIYLEAPDALMDLVPIPSQQTVWAFPDANLETVTSLFAGLGLSDTLLNELKEKSVWHISATEVRVHPNPRVVEELPIGARLKIYQVLRRYDENPFHRNPTIIASGDVQGWFESSGISQKMIAAIDHLTYPYGTSLAFSDLPFLLSLATSEKEERDLRKAITRTRTLILRMRVDEKTDFEAISSYWTAGFKYKDVLPLLESIERTKGVERIDIAHLLPPLPRRLLYTFPTVTMGMTGQFPDSFWTCLNFFEFTPKERYLRSDEVEAEISKNFTRVAPPYRYGDLLIMIDPTSRQAVHSSIYLADDIIYTKKRSGLLSPWVLMRLPDLVTSLASDQPPVFEGWRHRDAVAPTPVSSR